MFSVKKEPFGDFSRLKLCNDERGEYVSIIPEFGANVNEIVLSDGRRTFSVLEGDKTYSDLAENKWFRGAKLIPFPNRINNGKYSYRENEYTLPINFPSQNHAIHGLIYNKKFRVKKIQKTKGSASVLLEYRYRKDVSGYPFDINIVIRYSLSKKGFGCVTKIVNAGNTDAPVGDGWHPYFKITGSVDHLMLKIPSARKIRVDKKMIPTGKFAHFAEFESLRQIRNIEFDTGFALPAKNGIANTELYDSKQNVRVCVWQETGKQKYNYLQVFIPASRKSIAIEPMTCNTDAFNNKDGLILLKPRQCFVAGYGVYIK